MKKEKGDFKFFNYMCLSVIVVFSLMTFVGCGGGGGDEGVAPASGGGTTTIFEAQETIGPSGGVVEVTDPSSPLYGVKIEIPAGALDSDTTIGISIPTSKPAIPANNLTRIGDTIKLTPSGTKFQIPVEITLPYDNNINENSEVIVSAIFDEISGTWEVPTLLSVDEANNTITVELTHFSIVDKFKAHFQLANINTDPTFDFAKDTFSIINDPDTDLSSTSCNNSAGACWGISHYAQWFFNNKRGEPCYLHNAYKDDEAAEIACAAFQAQYSFINQIVDKIQIETQTLPNSDPWTYGWLHTALNISRKPQFLAPYPGSPFKEIGHSVLVTGWNSETNCFEVYDPNYNDESQSLCYDSANNKFIDYSPPYSATYTNFYYIAFSSLVNGTYSTPVNHKNMNEIFSQHQTSCQGSENSSHITGYWGDPEWVNIGNAEDGDWNTASHTNSANKYLYMNHSYDGNGVRYWQFKYSSSGSQHTNFQCYDYGSDVWTNVWAQIPRISENTVTEPIPGGCLSTGQPIQLRVLSATSAEYYEGYILQESGSGVIDNDGDGYTTDQGDCNDDNNSVYPGASELCDGIDNQCPGDSGYGAIDEGCTIVPYPSDNSYYPLGINLKWTFDTGETWDIIGTEFVDGELCYIREMLNKPNSMQDSRQYLYRSGNDILLKTLTFFIDGKWTGYIRFEDSIKHWEPFKVGDVRVFEHKDPIGWRWDEVNQIQWDLKYRYVREVVSTTATVNTPAGTFDNCLKLKVTVTEYTIDHSNSSNYNTKDTITYQYRAKGIGHVKETDQEGNKIGALTKFTWN